MTRSRRWLKPVALLALSLAAGWLLLRFVGRIQWSAVGEALGHLAWWQGGVLVALLLVRQAFNAVPISRFVPGLSLPRAMQNDMSANLVATVAPPPGDVVLRVGMFRSWGIHPVDGMAGVTLTMIVFYGARFIAPVLGLALLAFVGLERGQWISGIVSGALAAALLTALILGLRSEVWAAVIGRTAARVVGRLRATVDADAWEAAVVDFRARVSATLRRNLVPALAGMLAAILTDGAILLLSLRFVGLGAEAVPAPAVFGAFLLAYPLTILPLFGLGALDAIVIASWTELAGVAYEEVALAGTIVWRATTLGGTLILGALCVGWWRWSMRRVGSASESTTTGAPV